MSGHTKLYIDSGTWDLFPLQYTTKTPTITISQHNLENLSVLNSAINGGPSSQAAAALAKYPHRHGQEADEDVESADDAEDLQGTLGNDPGADEVVHAEGVDIAQVEGGEGFGGFVTVALGDVAVDPA